MSWIIFILIGMVLGWVIRGLIALANERANKK